jgi:hypothetical protein
MQSLIHCYFEIQCLLSYHKTWKIDPDSIPTHRVRLSNRIEKILSENCSYLGSEQSSNHRFLAMLLISSGRK